MAKPSQAKTPTDPDGSEGSERRSASMPGAARPEFEPVSAADVFSELSSDRPADPVPPAAPKTDPDLVRDHEILPAAPVEVESAPPSIPSAASVTAEDAPKPQGSIPVLPGHVIANRYEVLGRDKYSVVIREIDPKPSALDLTEFAVIHFEGPDSYWLYTKVGGIREFFNRVR